MKNLLVFVYRDSLGDCTNGGVTSRHNEMTLFWDCTREQAEKYCEEKNIDKDSALFLVERKLWGENHPYATPLIMGKGICMSGGNFVYTSDSRFPKTNSAYVSEPIHVHDRFETQEMYDRMSI